MSLFQAEWNAHWRTLRRGWQDDPKHRMVGLLGLGIQVAAVATGVPRLIAALEGWSAAGNEVLAQRLWLGMLFTWAVLGLFALLGSVQRGYSHRAAPLLLTFPIPPAARLRALMGMLLIEQLGSWYLLIGLVAGPALWVVLGWGGLGWLALLLSGMTVAAWVGLLIAMLLFRYALPAPGRALRCLAAGVVLFATIIGWIMATGQGVMISSHPPTPWAATAVALGLLALGLGPLARPTGRLYLESFLAGGGRSGGATLGTPPGIALLARRAAQRRDLLGGMLTKGLLRQSRNALNWARLLALGLYLAIFPMIAGLIPDSVPLTLVVAGYVTAIAVLMVIDTASSPIGGEGNRLALYLTAPIGWGEFLRVKLTLFLVPLGGATLLLALLLGLWQGLTLGSLATAAAAALLMVVGVATLVAWGSVWDSDLGLVIEGAAQTFMYEEAPITPRRMLLINLALMLVGTMGALLFALPLLPALAALALLDLGVGLIAWRAAHVGLRRLLA